MNQSVASTERTFDSNEYNSDEKEWEADRFFTTGNYSHEQIYQSTNIITGEVDSVADVFVVKYSMYDIVKQKSDMVSKVKIYSTCLQMIDPK